METLIKEVSIKQIQGLGLYSPLSNSIVKTSGIVTGVLRNGFFIQTPNIDWDGKTSDAVFVYSTAAKVNLREYIEVVGKVVDYLKHDAAKPFIQIHLDDLQILSNVDASGKEFIVNKIELTQEFLTSDRNALADLLNSINSMLVKIAAGQTFIAPSNPFGDYVLALDSQQVDSTLIRSKDGGVILDKNNVLQWHPGFRMQNYNHAPCLNVGAKLLSEVSGPLNYRADSYQILQSDTIQVSNSHIDLDKSKFQASSGSITIMTLNCFNLDPHIESESLVINPRQDIDDDWGEGRFHTLAQAIVLFANSPDIIALQEIQDNDGAEISETVDATQTYTLLCQAVEELCGIKYKWVDINPVLNADGGQPGGNIRNAYLYNPDRINLIEDSVSIIGLNEACFVDSRKPLLAYFEERTSGKVIACINLHLVSKRRQKSIFSPVDPGVDEKLQTRIDQAKIVHGVTKELYNENILYYVTGDFNDTEYSQTLNTILGHYSRNLVETLPINERYDYNHRGNLQVLMHGIVSKQMSNNHVAYEIIHGNELIGVKPGETSDKPSDHAYVIAKLNLNTV